jgi:regulator of sigma E protease
MVFLIGLLSTLLVLGIMIVIHELGHHLVAKWFGVRVEVFSVGFGKRLFGKVWHGTDYRLSALPFGGYVKMAGMDAVESKIETRTDDPGEFMNHPRWQRVLIGAAGPVMNILLAIVLLTGLFMVRYTHPAFLEKSVEIFAVDQDSPAAKSGFQPGDRVIRIEDKQNPTWEQFGISMLLYSDRPVDVAVMRGNEVVHLKMQVNTKYEDNFQGLQPKESNIVNEVTPGMPAEKAGMQRGDEVVALNGQNMPSMQSIIKFLQENKDKPLTVKVLRGEETKEFTVTPVLSNVEGDSKYRIGFTSSGALHVDKLSLPEAFTRSVQENKKNSLLIFTLLRKLVEQKVSLKQMDGPIGIGRAVSTAVQRPTVEAKAVNLIYLMAMISLNLGIFNLLPIPILDGGLILLTTIEGLMRRDISQRLKERIYQTAFVFLVLFAVVVIFNDVTKWMS